MKIRKFLYIVSRHYMPLPSCTWISDLKMLNNYVAKYCGIVLYFSYEKGLSSTQIYKYMCSVWIILLKVYRRRLIEFFCKTISEWKLAHPKGSQGRIEELVGNRSVEGVVDEIRHPSSKSPVIDRVL